MCGSFGKLNPIGVGRLFPLMASCKYLDSADTKVSSLLSSAVAKTTTDNMMMGVAVF